MKIKTGDINKIEIFAPGTAGERAIRVESKDDVQIFDIEEYPEIEIKPIEIKMLPELKKLKDENREQKRMAENALFVAGQVDKLIAESNGKTWVPLLDLPQKSVALICRAKDILSEDYCYFCSEFCLSVGWRDFPSNSRDDGEEDSMMDWFDLKDVEALV